VLLNFGIVVCLGNSRIPQLVKAPIWPLLDGHGEAAGGGVTTLATASFGALLPPIQAVGVGRVREWRAGPPIDGAQTLRVEETSPCQGSIGGYQ
jgi:hypothetical protein